MFEKALKNLGLTQSDPVIDVRRNGGKLIRCELQNEQRHLPTRTQQQTADLVAPLWRTASHLGGVGAKRALRACLARAAEQARPKRSLLEHPTFLATRSKTFRRCRAPSSYRLPGKYYFTATTAHIVKATAISATVILMVDCPIR